jgi:hypothetical protein
VVKNFEPHSKLDDEAFSRKSPAPHGKGQAPRTRESGTPHPTPDRSRIVSTMLYYGKKINEERQSSVRQRFAELRIKIFAGISAPFITEGQLVRHLYKKFDAFLYGEKVAPLLTLEEGASKEDKAAFESFKNKVLKSPLFWFATGLMFLAERKLALVTFEASDRIKKGTLGFTEHPSFDTFKASIDEYNAAIGPSGQIANDAVQIGVLRTSFHFRRFQKESKRNRKAREMIDARAIETSKKVKKSFLRRIPLYARGVAKIAGGSTLLSFGIAGFTQGPIGWTLGASSIIVARRLLKKGYYELIRGREFPERIRTKKEKKPNTRPEETPAKSLPQTA